MILNLDGGELEDEPEELYALADLVHVACGGHAGDEASMDRVVRACAAHGTSVGAHPSFEDREGFGRRALTVAPDVLGGQIEAQCAALRRVAGTVSVASMKPHGALYHAADRDPALAEAVVAAAARALGDVAIVGPPGRELERAAKARGLRYLREAFADRGVTSDGMLIPRGEPGALVTDPSIAAAQARAIAARGDVDTICLHGDTPGAVAIARAVREAIGR